MGQLRKQAQALSARVRQGDADAAVALLGHSVQLGHGKLAIRRMFLAHAMGATVPNEYARYCAAMLDRFQRHVIEAMAAEEAHRALRYASRRTADG